MPANTRTKDQRLRDRAVIAERYLKGETQAAIAASLGISDKQVSYDVQKIRAEWRQNAVRDIGAHQAEELARLDALERTYWDAWQRSLQPLQHTQQDDDDADVSVRAGHAGQGRIPARRQRKRTSTRTEAQHGNPAFLSGVERCINARCRILGLFAPATVSLDGRLSFGDLLDIATAKDGSGRPDLHVLPPASDDDADALDAP